jgi:uncharacterized protein YqeY
VTRSLRAELESALAEALKRRDRVAASVCRTALSAIHNAEAVAVDAAPLASALETSPQGAGIADVPRRDLTEAEVRAVVLREVSERRAAIDAVPDGEWRRARLTQVELLESFLA